MKKIVSLALVCVLLVCSAFALASCMGNKLSGTYVKETSAFGATLKVSYTFKGDSVEISSVVSSAIGTLNPTTVTGTYEIKETDDGKKTITFNFGDEETPDGAEESGVALSFNEGRDDNGSYIEIGGTKYTKE